MNISLIIINRFQMQLLEKPGVKTTTELVIFCGEEWVGEFVVGEILRIENKLIDLSDRQLT